ncbi:C40 family peptidase [Lachnospiraceae bacterium LCP25S3_G4]
MKKFARTLIAATVVSSLVVMPVFAEPSVNELEQQKQAAQSAVSSLQSELTTVLKKMDDLEEKMVNTGTEIEQATKDLEVAKEKEEQQYSDMKLRIKYMYEEGSNSFFETILTADSFTDMINKAEYVSAVHKQDRDMLQEYEKTKQQVVDLKSTLESEMQNLESLQTEFEGQKESLNVTIESKQAEVSDFDQQLAEAAAAAAAAKEAELRAAAQQQASVSSNGGTSNSGSTNSNNSSNNGGGSNSGGGATTTPSTGGGGTGDSSVGSAIVSAAYSQLGVPYVWGGTSPGVGLDCSGLTQYAHRVAGIRIPRTSGEQLAGGRRVSDPQPGDIAWTPGHVAIYIGNGQMIEAQQTGTNIMVSKVRASAYIRYW